MLYNDRYATILADRHPDALGRPFLDVWAEVRDDLTPMVDRVWSGEPVHMGDIMLMLDRPGRAREAHFAFSYTPVRDERGAVVGLFCPCTETTDQVLAERARREAEASERNRLWVLSKDMLARANFQGHMAAVNPAWTAVLGWSEQHLLATPYSDFMHPDDTAVSIAALEEMGRTGLPTRFQNRIARAAGGWTPIGWTVSPEPDGVNFIAIGRDLSDYHAREAELVQTQEALRQSQKLESMGQLTGGVAHDFNNLLTPIIGSLDMLLQRGLGSERERRLIDGALQSAERAKTLVQRLLAFARRQPLRPTAVDLSELVHGMAGLEGSYRVGGFSLSANGTFTDAKIIASNDASVIGNRPRRQAEFIWRVAPEYEAGMFSVGASAIGTTSSYAQDSNQLKLPAFTQVNAFAAVRPIERVQLSVNANNIFDVRGFTESEEGSIPANGIVRARSINGRTISASLKFDF